MRVITEIVGEFADVYAIDRDQRGHLATRLLAAAGPDRRREVRTVTGRGAAFRVPVGIARAAGLIADPAAEPEPEASPAVEPEPEVSKPETKPEPDAEPKKAPARKAAPRKTTTKAAEPAEAEQESADVD